MKDKNTSQCIKCFVALYRRFLKFNSSSGEYHLGNITPQPTLLVCQYFGRNLAEGRPVGFRAQRSGWPGKERKKRKKNMNRLIIAKNIFLWLKLSYNLG